TTTGTVFSVTATTLTLTGSTLTANPAAKLTVAVTGSATGTVAVVQIGGDHITLTGPNFAGTLTDALIAGPQQTITRSTTSTSDWIKDGFAVGQQITLGGGVTGIFTISNVTPTAL